MTEAEALPSTRLSVPHGFFTRRGGVSTGPYATLNCSLSGQDPRESVMQNRARAARAIGADPARLVGCTQVHGATVVTVHDPWAPSAGPNADAMVTDRPGIALGIISADCAPVLFADLTAGVIGAAHAGWRGTLAGVLEATLAAMVALGAQRTRIAAAIGPCIAQASYEVGSDLRNPIVHHRPAHAMFFKPSKRGDRWQFDLAAYCKARLSGIDAIDVLALDTFADDVRFFSHRRRTLAGGGPTGHQISIVTL